MAEAIGVATGIIGVVGVAIQVMHTVVDFGLDWKEAPAEAQQLLHELKSLKSILSETLINDQVIRSFEPRAPQPDDQESVALMLEDCRKELRQLLLAIEKAANKGRGISWDRLKRTFETQRTRETVEKLCRKCNTINNGMAVKLGVISVKDVREMKGELRETKGELQGLRQDVRHQQSVSEREAVLNWLTPIDYAPLLSDLLERREAGTGDWLLRSDKFRDWLAHTDQTLFCPGIPGAGKTILTSIVIEDLGRRFRSDDAVGLAYLFCCFQQRNHKPSDLFLSILKQLVQQMPSLPQPVVDLYNEHRGGQTKPLLQDISRVLHAVLTGCQRAFIIVDGLDEYSGNNGEDRTRFLAELMAMQKKTAANIFATSRPIPEISDMFGRCPSLEIRASDTDMKKYIQGHMAGLPAFVQRNAALQQDIKTTIVDAARGMFLLAQLHLDSLRHKTSPKALRKALQQFASGGSYHSAYDDAMKRIENQGTDKQELAMQTLLWITCARRRLSKTELQHALAIEAGEAELDEENIPEISVVLSACAGLVTVDEESDSVRLIHYTAQEYFQETRGKWFPNGHTEIAEACLRYLSFDEFRSGPCPNDEALAERLRVYVLYDYAAMNWGHHAHEAGDGTFSTDTWDLVLGLLEDSYKTSASYQAIVFASRFRWSYDCFTTKTTGLHIAAYFGLAGAVDYLAGTQDLEAADSDGSTPLLLAARNGHRAAAEHLLDEGARHTPPGGRTPLWRAAENGHDTVVELLLQHGADPNAQDRHGRTPLWDAVLNGHTATANLLLARGADINKVDSTKQTLLAYMAQLGNEHMVRLLLNAGAAVDTPVLGARAPLGYAARHGHEAVARLLLENAADPDAVDRRGRTALWHAVSNGDEAIAALLLQAKADVGAADLEEWTPLLVATCNRHETIVKLLLEKGAEANGSLLDGRTPLSVAAERGFDDIATLLLQWGADPDAKDNGGRTPLSYAAENGHEPVVQLLIDRHVDLDSTTSSYGLSAGRTPLSFAAENGHYPIVHLLCECKAKPDSGDATGRTPLSFAAENGHKLVVRLLLGRGADVNSRASRGSAAGRTPLSFAAENGHVTISQLLLRESPLALDLEDASGRTPLSYAAEKGREALTRLLLQHEADPDSRDPHGWTPLWFAIQNGYMDVVQRLLNHEGDPDVVASSGPTKGHTPLSFAIEHGHSAIAELLLSRGAATDSRDANGRTPLSFAAEGGHQTLVELLLFGKDADADSRDANGRTPLSFAAQNGHNTVARLLLEAGAKPDSAATRGFDKGRTPLSFAAEHGREAIVRLLLEQHGLRVNVDSRSADKWTPLLYAVRGEHLSTARLLAQRADLDSQTSDGRTALSLAAESGNTAIAMLLIDAGGKGTHDLPDSSGRTPLSMAAQSGNKAIAEALLDGGAAVDSKTTAFNAGRTPLSFAAENGNVAVARLLLDRGADSDSADIDGWTPLLFAAQDGHLPMAKVLLVKGRADPNAQARGSFSKGRTALSLAAANGHADIADLLLDKGATVNTADADGRTPLSFAAENGYAGVASLLIRRKAALDAEDVDGRTPLSYADRQQAVLELLVTEGAYRPRELDNKVRNQEQNGLKGISGIRGLGDIKSTGKRGLGVKQGLIVRPEKSEKMRPQPVSTSRVRLGVY